MALKLLREARSAINTNLFSAGPQEVKQHPTLRNHQKIVDRIDRFFQKLAP